MMFGHKSFLRIGALSDSSISGLYKDSYELESCSYSFSQGTETNGKPQTDVRGGTIYLTYGGLPQDEMLRWMLGSAKIVFRSKTVNAPLRIEFTNAYCVNFDRSIDANTGICSEFIISPDDIYINGISFDNHWA